MDVLIHLVSSLNWTYVGPCVIVTALLYYWYHRPRKFPPGPRGFPIVGVVPLVPKYLERSLTKWSKEYGPVMSVRLGGRDVVTLNDYESIHEALVKSKEQFSGRDTHDLVDVFEDFGYGMIFADYGPFWKSQRKFGLTTLRGFGVGKRSMEDRVVEEIGYLNAVIANFQENPFDLSKPLSNAVSNNICSIIFGSRFDYDNAKFSKTVDRMSRGIGDPTTTTFLQVAFLFPFLSYFPPFSTKLKETINDYVTSQNLVQDIIDDHKESMDMENPRDFIDAYYAEMKKGSDSSFTKYQLRKFCHNLFFAGTETTTSTLRWAVLCLLHYPDMQKKLHKEIHEAIGDEAVVSMSDRKRLPYTCAFIEEVYRFRTLLPLSVAHKTTEDVHLRGFLIPKETKVYPNLWAVHNDPNLWKEPEKFIPDRHLDKHGTFVKSKHVIPFSLGARFCLGKQLAEMEVFIFLVSLLQKFEFQPSPDDDNLPEINKATYAGVYAPLRYSVVAKKIES